MNTGSGVLGGCPGQLGSWQGLPAQAVSREGLGQEVGTSSEHPVGRWNG